MYTFGPTFRAEKSFTTRHAAEFWMIEPEMAFCDLNGYMDTAEAMTKYVIRYVLDNCPDEMALDVYKRQSTGCCSKSSPAKDTHKEVRKLHFHTKIQYTTKNR